jgi:hypothetical protein
MVYQERGSGPPHFDGKNYHMWQRRMAAFLCGKGQILWDVTVNTAYVHLMNFLQDRGTYSTPTTRRLTTCTVLYVNRNSNGFEQRIWRAGFGSS